MFPATQIATKIALSLGVGMLVGLEREWARKEVGLRTFALAALLGMLSSLVNPAFTLLAVGGILLLAVCINVRSLMVDRSLEITTSVSLIVTTVLGVLIGNEHFFTAVSSAILMTLLLSWKTELSAFAGDLSPQEIRSAVLMGLLGFVIYPLLPAGYVDRWGLINVREAWVTVIALAAIGFVNYVFLRLLKTRGLYYTAVLGGFVNSTATVAQLAPLLSAQGMATTAIVLVLLTIVAMFLRNLFILAIFAPTAVASAVWPLGVMLAVAGIFVWRRHRATGQSTATLKISSPISLRRVLLFGLIFLIINVLGTLSQRYLGRFGFLIVSLLGGLVSSASTTAAAALMTTHGTISANIGGVATVLTSIASALINLPLVYQQTRQKALTRTLSALSFLLVFAGLVVLLARERFFH